MTSPAEKLFDEIDSLQVKVRGLRECRRDLIEQASRLDFEIGAALLELQARLDAFKVITESVADSIPGADAGPGLAPPCETRGGSFTLQALTQKGRERLPEIQRILAPLLNLPHGDTL